MKEKKSAQFSSTFWQRRKREVHWDPLGRKEKKEESLPRPSILGPFLIN